MQNKKENLYKRAGTYYLRYKVNGKEIRKSLSTSNIKEAEVKKKLILGSANDLKTETDVIHKVARAKKIYKPNILLVSILEDKFEKYLERKGASKDSSKWYKFRIKQFLSWLSSKHPEISILSEVSDINAQEYANWLNDTFVSNKLYNETLNALSLIFDVFNEEAGIVKNPFRKENTARKIKLAISRREFSKDQISTILESFKDIKDIPEKAEYEVLFYLGIFAGFRLKDAALLTWETIDERNNIIFVTPYKTKKFNIKIKIPIHPWLSQKLELAKSWCKNEYVLPIISEAYNDYRDKPGKIIRKILNYNGFQSSDKITQDTCNKRRCSPCLYGFHSFRYSFVSFCAESGVSMALVQDIVGHMNPAMTKHYTRFSNEYSQKAINSLSINAPKEPDLKDRIKTLIDSADDFKLEKIYKFIQEQI